MRSLGVLALVLAVWAPACSCDPIPEQDEARASGGIDDGEPTSPNERDDGADDPGSSQNSDAGTDLEMLEPAVTAVGGSQDVDNELFEAEIAARRAYANASIALRGRIVDASGAAVAEANVEVGGEQRLSDAEGRFEFAALPRKNVQLRVTKSGHRQELVYVHLVRPLGDSEALIDDVVLLEKRSGSARLIFGGDTSFGRRFVDPLEQADKLSIPESDPTALIDAADPLPGTRRALGHVRDLFRSADFGVVNLETPITDSPSEYHSTKEYSFFSLPESLEVFPWLGVQYVSLGNNHVFDYLTDGVVDTLDALEQYGIAHSGAGLTAEEAFAPYRVAIAGHPYSFLSMTSVSGSQNPPLYVATVDPDKAGAADLRDDERVTAAISAEVMAGRIPIVQLHTGQEYTFEPSDFAADRMALTVSSGAALVIAHHPHVAQGFAFEDGVLVVHSLGNFCFDQARVETMLGLLAQVDLEGANLVRAVGRAVYLEDFTPRPAVGELAEYLMRRIGEVSRGAQVGLSNGLAVVTPLDGDDDGDDDTAIPVREQELSVDLQATGGIVDLRAERRPGESLLQATLAGALLQPGEDLLNYGDFEDWDVDDEQLELSRWDVTGGSSFTCLSDAHRGAASLCSVREAGNESNSVIAFRNRVRVLGEALGVPNKDLSLVGYASGDNAGELWIEVQYYASVGDREFDREVAWRRPAGSYAWQPFGADLHMAPDDPDRDPLTANPHALRLFIFQTPPSDGTAIARLDDLAVVSWRPEASESLTLRSPNPVDFLRVLGASGKVRLSLRWQSAP